MKKKRESYFEDLAFQMGLGPEREPDPEKRELTQEEMFLILCEKLDKIAWIVMDFANGKDKND